MRGGKPADSYLRTGMGARSKGFKKKNRRREEDKNEKKAKIQ